MSLHAQLSPESLEILHKQKRNSTISSVIIALLAVILMALLLGVFLLPNLTKEIPVIVTYEYNLTEETSLEKRKVQTNTKRKPAAPSASMAKVITSNTQSPLAIPTPDVEVSAPSLDFGDGQDFGAGWGDGDGIGGGGGGFGSPNPASGGLEGYLYDLKQDSRKKALPYNADSDFPERINSLQRSRFSHSQLSKYFRSPTPLYLTHLAVPYTNASEGPKLFKAEKDVKPIGWVAYYQGSVIAPKSGTFRFSGLADDYLMVAMDGKVRLHASWPSLQPLVSKGWKPTGPANHPAPFNHNLIYGDWVKLREGQVVKLDIAIGERPGGQVWFYLAVEEQGVNYRKAANGRPILPLFATAPLQPKEIDELNKKFKGYEMEFDQSKALIFRVNR